MVSRARPLPSRVPGPSPHRHTFSRYVTPQRQRGFCSCHLGKLLSPDSGFTADSELCHGNLDDLVPRG